MRSKKLVAILGVMILAGSSALQAQQGFGTNKPHPTAAVDITSTTKGFLPPRMNDEQMNNIPDPTEGLIIYNTTRHCLMYYSQGEFKAPVHRPVANNVAVNGLMRVGDILTSTYTYSHIENLSEGTPTYRWYSATDAEGAEKKNIANSPIYIIGAPVEAHNYIAVGVIPVTTTGKKGFEALSPWRQVVANAVPVFTSVTNAATAARVTFCATSTTSYSDYDDDPAGTPSYQWYRFSNTGSATGEPILDATESTYTFTTDDLNKYIKVGVTPKATSGLLIGAEKMASTYLGPVGTSGCGTLKVTHTAGDVAPVTKTVMYETVASTIGGTEVKCWITQNLGADYPATSVRSSSVASSGWYWQFNRKQGYEHDGATRTPSTWNHNGTTAYLSWDKDLDPCTILLGSAWTMPAKEDLELKIFPYSTVQEREALHLPFTTYTLSEYGARSTVMNTVTDTHPVLYGGTYFWSRDRLGASGSSCAYLLATEHADGAVYWVAAETYLGLHIRCVCAY